MSAPVSKGLFLNTNEQIKCQTQQTIKQKGGVKGIVKDKQEYNF